MRNIHNISKPGVLNYHIQSSNQKILAEFSLVKFSLKLDLFSLRN